MINRKNEANILFFIHFKFNKKYLFIQYKSVDLVNQILYNNLTNTIKMGGVPSSIKDTGCKGCNG